MKKTLLAFALVARLLPAGAVAASAAEDPTIAAPLGTAISYQGKLDKNGVPLNGNCNFTFKLFNALSGPSQIGITVNVTNQPVSAGLFSVSLDFGPGAFDGQARWLEIQVQGPGDPGFTLLTPRQTITAAPYSLFSLNNTGSQWVTDASGITFGGNAGVGTPSSSSVKLHVDSGTADANAMYVHSNNNNGWATMVLRNFGTNGFGLYDDTSAKHFIGGRFGVGTTNPDGKLQATSSSEAAVIGKHTGNWVGVYGESQTGTAVWGNALSTGTGVQGSNATVGAFGYLGHGNGWGVTGDNTIASTRGILGTPTEGVVGVVHSTAHIAGRFDNDAVGGTALYANGVAKVKTLQILGGADLAERFVSAAEAEPGTVMAIDPSSPGGMRIADEPYSRHVAGVVSGAQSLPAGVVLGLGDEEANTVPIALTGRVWVKCDASEHPIQPGDLLTTSKLAGHAMAATDVKRGAGAILGKAMTSLEAGTGMVLVLVSLQ